MDTNLNICVCWHRFRLYMDVEKCYLIQFLNFFQTKCLVGWGLFVTEEFRLGSHV